MPGESPASFFKGCNPLPWFRSFSPLLMFHHRGVILILAFALTNSRAAELNGSALRPRPGERPVGFRKILTENSGLTFAHQIPTSRSLTNQMLLDGSGVALTDIDGDGRIDIFFGASDGQSQLWRNLGNWRFVEQTESAFPDRKRDLSGDVTGVAFADLNGDHKPDLVLNSHADGVRILTNTGAATFRALPFRQGQARGGHSVAIADIDGDGWLDIYICNYRQRALMDMPSARATFQTVNGVPQIAMFNGRPASEPDLTNRFRVGPSGELEEMGEPDIIYQNHGGTNFTVVRWTNGNFLDEEGNALAEPPRDWGLAAQFCDVNGDGRPDLYVCNDFQSPDRFWINLSTPGQVRLRLVSRSALRHTSLFSMGVDFADFNRDGRWDFFIVDMLSPDHVRRLTSMDGSSTIKNNYPDPLSRPQLGANTLFLQRSDRSYVEVANLSGVAATDWSWTPLFLDVDLDGWPDLLVSAGQERGSRELDIAEHMKQFRRSGLRTDAQIFRERQRFPRQSAPLKAFRNQGTRSAEGLPRFEDVSTTWGFDYDGVSHGMAVADLDGDGDLDVVVNHLQAPAGLYENLSTAPRIHIRLQGNAPNTAAIGAELRCRSSGTNSLPQLAQVTAGSHYLSSDDGGKTFACGDTPGVLEIRWPSGQITTERNLQANRFYEIKEPEGLLKKRMDPPAPAKRLRFEARVVEEAGKPNQPIDFVAQPSLPRLQSTRWPCLAITGDTNSELQLWIGKPQSRLRARSQPFLQSARELGNVRSVIAVVPWGGHLIAATDAWQGTTQTNSRLVSLERKTGVEQIIKAPVPAISCLAFSAAGSTNFFIGSGSLLGDYPNSGRSALMQWQAGGFQASSVTNLGLVTAAVFARLRSSTDPDLITVSEWGPPRIFRIDNGRLIAWNPPVHFQKNAVRQLGDLNGLWQSVAAEDLDGDGRKDLVLGNWGLNSPFALYTGPALPPEFSIRSLSLYHGIFQGNARTCFQCYSSAEGRELPIQGLNDLSRHLPWISEKFNTHRSFANADAPSILGAQLAVMQRVECRWLASLVLFNRGDHFEAFPLPDLAQAGPIFGLQTGDFDGDGHADVYCAQGFFGYNFNAGRDDTGEGVFLLSRGDSSFDALSTVDAGFRLLGEQRSVLSQDMDGDGRPDLVVGEYGGTVTLLLNRRP